METKNTEIEEAPCQSKLSGVVMPRGNATIFFIIMFGMTGAGSGVTGNFVAAIFAIVILVNILNDESSKKLIKTQREYIDLLERTINKRMRA